MSPTDDVAGLIGRIYDGVLGRADWSETLLRAAEQLGARAAITACIDVRAGTVRYVHDSGVDAGMMEQLMSDYHPRNPWFERASSFAPGTPVHGEMMVPRAELVRTDFYSEILAPLEIPVSLGTNFAIDEDTIAFFAVFQSFQDDSFSHRAERLFTMLGSHLERAARLTLDLSSLEEEPLAVAALHMLRMGVFMVDARGRVLFVNRAGEAIMQLADGLLIRRGELWAQRSGQTSRLRGIIAGALRTSEGSSFAPGGAMTIDRPSGLRPFQVVVTPVPPRSPLNHSSANAAALIFVTDPEEDREDAASVLQRLYGLTPTEAELGVVIATGTGLGEAAEQMGISVSTARTHLKRIFSKTDTNRQAQFVQLFVAGPGQILMD